MKMKVNEMVQIYGGGMGISGILTYEKFIIGTIVEVNEKSVEVHMTNVKYATNGEITSEQDIDEKARFDFWKTIKNKQSGKKASIYKNREYGIIEIVH